MKKSIEDKLRKQVVSTCEKHNLISKGSHIVLGLSGGPDSMCLYDVLLGLAGSMNLVIHPVHVNHKFRPGEAERDQAFVEQVCRENAEKYPGIAMPCRSFVIDCAALARETGMTGEEAGRKVRYDAFFQVAEEIAGSQVKIAVAHNANDQAETILFRMLRGTGTDGLAGMAYEREEIRKAVAGKLNDDAREQEKYINTAHGRSAGGTYGLETGNVKTQGPETVAIGTGGPETGKTYKVIRPLLDVWREDIEIYCREKNLNPVIDHTNSEELYSRNRIRLDLIPYIRSKYNENIEAGLVRLGRIAAEDKEFLWQETERMYNKLKLSEAADKLKLPGEGTVTLDREGLAACHESIRHRIMQKAFAEIGLESDITAERIEAADRIILKKQGEKTVEFPHGYRLRVAKGQVHFEMRAYVIQM